MKRRFSKILGLGLTLALLASLLLTAVPVSALTQPSVILDYNTISYPDAKYSIVFSLGATLDAGEDIIVTFPTGTDISNVATGDVTLAATSGIGTDAFSGVTTSVVDVTGAPTMLITIPAAGAPMNAQGSIGVGALVQVVIDDVINPSTPGIKSLDVSTTNEAAVTSTTYTIIPILPSDLPGIVQVFNPGGYFIDQDTGPGAIGDMLEVAGANYTIEVGPGTYTEGDLTIDQEGLILVSTDEAVLTIIKGSITIDAAGVTVDGFTVEHSGAGIRVLGADAIVINNILTASSNVLGIEVSASATGAIISGNELDINSTMYLQGSGHALSDNTFGAGINLAGTTSQITITGNTIIGSEYEGINLDASPHSDILIENNIISATTLGDVVGIYVRNGSKIKILNNEITDNEGDGIRIAIWSNDNVIKFNTITGNTGLGINSAETVDAAFNWWGTSVAAEVAAMASDNVTTAPFLADTAEAVFSATKVGVGVELLDARTTVGVKVSGATGAAVIVVAKYVANPEEDIAGTLAFFDVYVAGSTDDTITLKLYAGDENSKLYVWSRDTDQWVDLSDDASFGFSVYGGYLFITVDADLLDGTPFAVVDAPAPVPPMDEPVLSFPELGEEDIPLTPAFAWEPVDGTLGYWFELSDNLLFVTPLAQFRSELGYLDTTFYAYVGELDYSTYYYWRVKALDGDFMGGLEYWEGTWYGPSYYTLASNWTSAVFRTMDEPVEPTPPIVIEDVPPPQITITQPDIIIEQPDIIVELPAPVEQPLTPSWIYVIIGVGGVLVISVITLIVRTRRVA